jgi:short-subunit dehydrogenase
MEGKKVIRPLAVLTGAASGIGYELAKQFAQHDYDLIIVSENPAIVEAAQTCRYQGVDVESYVIDLTEQDGINELIDILRTKIDEQGRKIEALALTASIGEVNNYFQETNLEIELGIINLNVIATVHLIKFITKKMMERKSGKILLMSEIYENIPTSLQTVYEASKAFIKTFSKEMKKEFHDSGIIITEFIPEESESYFSKISAEIAEEAFTHLTIGNRDLITGLNKLKSEEGKFHFLNALYGHSKLRH